MKNVPTDDVQLYLKLVEAFKPPKSKADEAIEDKEKSIIVAARIRPMLEEECSQNIVASAFPRKHTTVVDVHELRKTARGTAALNSSSYLLDKVYSCTDATETVYNDLVRPLVPWAWSGGVSTVFTYGQTGSGKTYTVSGLERLIADDLFSVSPTGARNIFVSIVELAGNSASDLLSSRRPVSILEDSFGTTHLAGASEYNTVDRDSLINLFNCAASLRQTQSTQKNDKSSRSHSICKIRLANPALPEAEDGLLFVVDLAGSEAARDVSGHSSDRMREAREINTSLSVLKDCIRGSAKLDGLGGVSKATPGRKPYIPFRQTALTKLLKHIFDPAAGRSCKTAIIACLNPCLPDVGATKNTLRYAEMLRVVKPQVSPLKYEPATPTTWSNQQLRDWIVKHSGTPPILAEVLSPSESGKQLLRLPTSEFITRCMVTPGVSKDQAVAFQTKFWKLHVDSQHAPVLTSRPQVSAGENDDNGTTVPGEWKDSSREFRAEMQSLHFKERLRPGMVVAWTPGENPTVPVMPGSRNLAMLLSQDTSSSLSPGTAAEGSSRTYLCAFVGCGIMPGAFELHPWLQHNIDERQMDTEVILEYDSATRYYYESL